MKGIVLSYIRRKITVLAEDKLCELLTERKFDHVLPGDSIDFEGNEIRQIFPRINVFKRSYQEKTKEIAANLDALFIITAPPPLFNTTVIDRLICTAELENMTPCLVLNKSDLGYQDAQEAVAYYQNLGIRIFHTTAKGNVDTGEIENFLNSAKPAQSAFAGVSGVGKSSLLKALLPDTEFRTNEVSDKTGQGRQTTSLAEGYQHESACLLFDLPGIQSFGLSHLTIDLVQHGFKDIFNLSAKCKFSSSCNHLLEPGCAVKAAVENKSILPSRYESYKLLLAEVRQANTY